MNPQRIFIRILYLISIVSLLCFCQKNGQVSKNPPKNDSIVVEDIDSSLITLLNNKLETEDSTKSLLHSKGKIWRLWKNLHHDCQNSTIAKNMLYFGPTNTLGLGTILLIDEETHSINPDFPLLKDSLTINQKSLIYNNGNPANCEFAKEVSVTVDFLAKSKINTTVDASLQSQIKHAKNIRVKIDSWQVNNLYIGGLSSVLNETNREYFKNYKNRIKKENRYIITKEILINGFSGTIQTSTKISADLKAQLEKGVIDKLGDTEAQVKFSYGNETTINMVTLGSFNVFCEAKKAKIID